MKDKCKDCYFSDNGDCTCSGVKMCVSNRDERRQTMSKDDLISRDERCNCGTHQPTLMGTPMFAFCPFCGVKIEEEKK